MPGPVLALAPTSCTLPKCRSCRLERRKTAKIFHPYTNHNAPPRRWKASEVADAQDSKKKRLPIYIPLSTDRSAGTLSPCD